MRDDDLANIGDAIARTTERPPAHLQLALVSAARALRAASRSRWLRWRLKNEPLPVSNVTSFAPPRTRESLRSMADDLLRVAEGTDEGARDYQARFELLALARGFDWPRVQEDDGPAAGPGEEAWRDFAAGATLEDAAAILAQLRRMLRDERRAMEARSEHPLSTEFARFGGKDLTVPPRHRCCRP